VRVLAPDARGHGRSGPITGVTLDDWVDDITAVLGDAGVESAVLAGVSMGGVQALAFALAHPGQVRSVLIADSFAELDPEIAEAKIAGMAGAAERKPMSKVADDYVDATFLEPYPTGVRNVRRAIASADVTSYIASVRACFGVRLLDRIADIGCPVRIAWGDRDEKAPRALSEAMVATIDGASLGVIPAAGHLSNIDNPEGFASEVRLAIEIGSDSILRATKKVK
jgi:pimeloyl-ACP methyl ester carboxylesterase